MADMYPRRKYGETQMWRRRLALAVHHFFQRWEHRIAQRIDPWVKRG